MKPLKPESSSQGIDLSVVYPNFYLWLSIMGSVKEDDFHTQRRRLREEAEAEAEETAHWLAPILLDYLTIACMGELRHGAKRASVVKTGVLQKWGLINAPFSGTLPPEKPKSPLSLPPPDICNDPDCSTCKANQQLFDEEKAKFGDAAEKYDNDLAKWGMSMDAWHEKSGVSKEGFDHQKFMAEVNAPQKLKQGAVERSDAQDHAPLSDDAMNQESFLLSAVTGFKAPGWDSSYGGNSWAEIAKTAWRFRKGELSPIIFTDAVAQLRHNGGILFDKRVNLIYFRDESENVMRLLDMKRDARNACDLSARLQNEWQGYSTNKNLQSWCKRVDKWVEWNPSHFVAELSLCAGNQTPAGFARKLKWFTCDGKGLSVEVMHPPRPSS